MKGDWPLKHKDLLVGDHEGADVVAKGTLAQGVELGAYFAIKWLNGSCLSCLYCLNGDEPLCPKALLSEYTVNSTFERYTTGKVILDT